MSKVLEQIEKLTRALEAGGYMATPSILRQGTLSLGPEATFEDYEREWNNIDAIRGLQAFLFWVVSGLRS